MMLPPATVSSTNRRHISKKLFSFVRSTEDCVVPICCGLYRLLRGILLILPDAMLQNVMDKLIQPDVLIVLVNHPSVLIQQGVIKVGKIIILFTYG